MNRKLTMLVAIVSAVVITTSVHAGTIAYDSPAGLPVNQTWGGTAGMRFSVVEADGISVTKLGVWDDAADGAGVSNSNVYRVAIFDQTSQSIVTGLDTTISSADTTTVVNGNVLKAITPVVLPVGNYVIAYDASLGINRNSPYPTQNTGGGLIAFPTGESYYRDTGFAYPYLGGGTPSNHFHSGTFEFQAVPEPNTFLLIGLGFLGMSVACRRRRQRSRS